MKYLLYRDANQLSLFFFFLPSTYRSTSTSGITHWNALFNIKNFITYLLRTAENYAVAHWGWYRSSTARFCTVPMQHDRSGTDRLCTRIIEHRIDWTRHDSAPARLCTNRLCKNDSAPARFCTKRLYKNDSVPARLCRNRLCKNDSAPARLCTVTTEHQWM